MAMRMHGRTIEVTRKTWLLIGALAVSVAIPPWFLMYALYRFSPNFELNQRKALERPQDPNWRTVSALGDKAWRSLSRETFTALNGGDWTSLCVNGGYTDPIATFEAANAGAKPPNELRARFDRPTPVGEYDLAVSFADRLGRMEVIYLVDGGSLQSLDLAWCTRR